MYLHRHWISNSAMQCRVAAQAAQASISRIPPRKCFVPFTSFSRHTSQHGAGVSQGGLCQQHASVASRRDQLVPRCRAAADAQQMQVVAIPESQDAAVSCCQDGPRLSLTLPLKLTSPPDTHRLLMPWRRSRHRPVPCLERTWSRQRKRYLMPSPDGDTSCLQLVASTAVHTFASLPHDYMSTVSPAAATHLHHTFSAEPLHLRRASQAAESAATPASASSCLSRTRALPPQCRWRAAY